MICSRCGKDIKDMYVKILTSFEVVSLTEEGCAVPYSNISEPTSETLCTECFNDYCNCLNSLNESNNGELLVDMIQVIDEVQYGSGLPDIYPQESSNKDALSVCPCESEPFSLAEMVELVDE